MATSSIRAGAAFVELLVKDDSFAAKMKTAEKSMLKFAAVAKQVGAATLAAGATIATAFAPPVKAASDAMETMNKFEAVFKEQSDAAKAFADNLAASVGRSKYEIYDAMAAFDAFAVGLGFGGREAREMAQSLAELAIDFGSLYNVSDAEAVERFISAMSGSSEVLDKFGINIKAAALETELLSMGVNKSWQEVSEAEKVQARFNVILKSMTAQGAVGDAVKTAGSFGNSMKRLRGEIKDASVQIGNALLPVVTPLVSKAVEMAKAASEWAAENETLIVTIAKGAVATAGLGASLYALGTAVGVTAQAVGALNAALTFVAANPVLVTVAALGAGIAATTIAIDRLTSHTAQLNDEMSEARVAADAKRAADQQAIQRLEQLANQQSLTSSEMDTAAAIIKNLESRYGDLGLSVDTATGKILGLADAQQAMNDEMKRAAELSIRAEIAERQANVDELTKQMQNPSSVSYWGAKFRGEDASDAPYRRAQAELQHIEALNARLKALAGGDVEAVSGQTPGPAGVPGGGLPMPTAEQAADFNAKIYERLHDLRVAQIEDEEQRELEAIDWKYKQELIEARKLGANLEALDYARRQEIEAVEKKHADRRLLEAEAEAQARREQELADLAGQDLSTPVKGTFSAMAAMRFGASAADSRLLDSSERTAEATEAMLAKLDGFLTAV